LGGHDASKDGIGSAPTGRTPVILRYKQAGTLCLDGDRFAYTYGAPGAEQVTPAGRRGRIPTYFKVVRTETDYLRYSDLRSTQEIADASTAAVVFRQPERCREAQLPDVYPLVLALRPLEASISAVDLAHYSVAPTRGFIGDTSCMILDPSHQPTLEPKAVVSLWVDPTRDYVIRRAIVSFKGEERSRVDIDYASDPTCGWMPSGWSWFHLNEAQNLDFALRATLDARTFNTPVSPSEFTIDPPEGAVVHDARGGSDVIRRIGMREPPVASASLTFHVVVLGNIVLVVVCLIAAVRKYLFLRSS